MFHFKISSKYHHHYCEYWYILTPQNDSFQIIKICAKLDEINLIFVEI